MTATMNIDRIGFSQEVFEEFLNTRSEPTWVTDARRAAFTEYLKLLADELDPEEFKRVDLRTFNASKFRPATGESDASSVKTLLCVR